jgi:CBS-domain-containing membrane protein
MKRTVQDVMTKTVVVVRESAPFKEIVRQMHEYRVSALPVMDAERRIVGIVSEADLLLKEEYPPPGGDGFLFDSRRRKIERAKAAGLVASQLMSAPVITIGPAATLDQAGGKWNSRA